MYKKLEKSEKTIQYWIESLPAEPGSYALHLILNKPACLVVGRLGEFSFPVGEYLYLGSAHGPGGLRARLRHHARVRARPNWHLDWLRPYVDILGGWYASGIDSLECAWSQALLRLPGVMVPAPGFGAADCRSGCRAHLVLLPVGIKTGEVECVLKQVTGELKLHLSTWKPCGFKS